MSRLYFRRPEAESVVYDVCVQLKQLATLSLIEPIIFTAIFTLHDFTHSAALPAPRLKIEM